MTICIFTRRNVTRTLIVGLCLCAQSVAASETLTANVENPERAFGYSIGDVLEQRIHLETDDDTLHKLVQAPDEQRVGRWLTRHSARIDDEGRWLSIRYQVINATPAIRVVNLPAMNLPTQNGNMLFVPEWSFSIAPLIAHNAEQTPSLPIMQADASVTLPSSDEHATLSRIFAIALGVILALWGAWWLWRNMHEANTLPFARAYRQIKKTTNSDKSSWIALHQALDKAALISVNQDKLPVLFKNTHWLEPFEQDIRQFLEASSKEFFSMSDGPAQFDVEALAKSLYKAERQHNRLRKRTAITESNAS